MEAVGDENVFVELSVLGYNNHYNDVNMRPAMSAFMQGP